MSIHFLLKLLFNIFLVTGLISRVNAMEEEPKKPNIVIFLADDAGYGDFSSYGSKYGKTPVIDSLAEQGMKFTDFYAAASICSPSRAGLMTGRIPARTGIYTFIPESEQTVWLPKSEITFPQLLKQQGYATCHVGKWHLSHLWRRKGDRNWGGKEDQPQPSDFGFDYTFGTTNNALKTHHNPHNFSRNGDMVGPQEGYACQLVADEGISWLQNREDKSQPFLLYVAYNEPHETVAAPEEMVSQFTAYTNDDKKKELHVRTYYGALMNMDNSMGRILAYLDEAGLSDDTIVIFYSDNGSRKNMSYWAGTNLPLRGYKGNVWDGGIRSPAVIRWPGVIQSNSVSKVPVSAIDMLPTLCAITGAKIPEDRAIDGVNIMEVLKGGTEINRETPLFWFQAGSTPAVSMRDGDWSLVGYLNKFENQEGQRIRPVFNPDTMEYIKTAKFIKFELFNIREDMSQTKKLAEIEPERFETMKAQMTKLFAEVVEEGPTWRFEEAANK